MRNSSKASNSKLSWTVACDSFGAYLQQVKQLTGKTISVRLSCVRRLFIELNIDSHAEWNQQLSTDSISRFFLDCEKPRVRDMSVSARSFFKYCHLYNILDRDFSALIPTVRCWRLSHIPKAVSDEHIRQLLDSIEGSSAIELRDKALITLLAVYGVRGVHLRRLCLDDLDWKSGEIHFPAVKGGRRINQVMTTEAGNCLSAYLLKGRPQEPFKQVFLTHGPVHPMNDSRTVSDLLWRRFKSAQIQLPQGVSYGSHGLRHAFGARLVGTIPLHELGAMLGHKDLSSTLLYSKVAFSMLREAALPWPREASDECL